MVGEAVRGQGARECLHILPDPLLERATSTMTTKNIGCCYGEDNSMITNTKYAKVLLCDFYTNL